MSKTWWLFIVFLFVDKLWGRWFILHNGIYHILCCAFCLDVHRTDYELINCSIKSHKLLMVISTSLLNTNLEWIMGGNPHHLIMKVSKYYIHFICTHFVKCCVSSGETLVLRNDAIFIIAQLWYFYLRWFCSSGLFLMV